MVVEMAVMSFSAGARSAVDGVGGRFSVEVVGWSMRMRRGLRCGETGGK